jgi:hypothetical protein
MADKQSGTGARGKGHKSAEGHRNSQTNNPVSAKNQSKQKQPVNRSTQSGGPDRGKR